MTLKRKVKYDENMHNLQQERYKVAIDLMQTLDTIEQQSGIFLIKPMYSYKGRNAVEEFMKRSEDFRKKDAIKKNNNYNRQSPLAAYHQPPATTPAQQYYKSKSEFIFASRVLSNATWNMQDSMLVDRAKLPLIKTSSGTTLTTPRILELDVNRMMITQNQIAASMGSGESLKDRLFNPSNNLRSYVTINRPSGVSRKEVSFSAASLTKPATPPTKQFTTPLPPINQVDAVIIERKQSTKHELTQINDTSINTVTESVIALSYSRANTDLIKQE